MTLENASSPKQESPFAQMYQPNGEAFNLEFARLYEVNFGGSAKGAEMHHRLLAKWCKTGFSYHGKWPNDKIHATPIIRIFILSMKHMILMVIQQMIR